jgi:hypothetical protein
VRGTRWLIFAPVAILALFSSVTHAEPIQGLNTTYYTIDEIPPVQSTNEYEECGSELENNINRSYDGEPFENCTGDLFMVHMQGYIEIPEHETIEFWLASDDGGEATIGGNTWGSWADQGCSAWQSGNLTLQAGSVPLEVWMYENGGGTCLMLAWKIDDNEWEIVPDSAFTTEPYTPDTTVPIETTEVSTTLETTTTIPSTTTSSSTIPDVQTTVAETSTTSASTTSSTTTTTTTTTSPIEEIQQPTTGTTTSTTFVEPTPETTVVDTTLPEVTTNATDPPADTLPFVTITSPPEPPESLPEPSETTEPVEPTPTTLLFPDGTQPPQEISDEQFDAALDDLDGALPDQITAIVDTLLESDLSSDQATELVTNVQVLTALTSDQATQVFAEIQETQLTEAAAETIAEALNNPDVPQEVKEAFEDEINIFGNDGFSGYVPVDSNVSVAVRRTIIAGTTVLVAMPPPSARRR